jgi:hypothetical protein
MHTITSVDGTPIAYDRTGDGDPLILMRRVQLPPLPQPGAAGGAATRQGARCRPASGRQSPSRLW